MTVGIPGTGLGGLFYFVLVALMPFYELYRTVRGTSSLVRWRQVGFQLSLLFSMFFVLWIEAWILDGVFSLFASPDHAGSSALGGIVVRSGQFAAVASMIILATLLAGVALLRHAPALREAPGAR